MQGDPLLENPYGAIVVDPARHAHVKAAEAQAFVDWLVSEAGQAAIDGFRVNGERLFYPRAVTDSGATAEPRATTAGPGE